MMRRIYGLLMSALIIYILGLPVYLEHCTISSGIEQEKIKVSVKALISKKADFLVNSLIREYTFATGLSVNLFHDWNTLHFGWR